MKLSFYPHTLEFRYPFRIAHGMRTTTPVVYVEIEENGITGYGEAAMPPYLSENTETVCNFLSEARHALSLYKFKITDGIEKIIHHVNSLQTGNFAAKAAIDIALHDLYGKIHNISLKKYFGTENLPAIFSTYTIGMCNAEEMRKKISDAKDFKLFKLKLGGDNDKKIIENFINSPYLPIAIGMESGVGGEVQFCTDVNQGWKDKYFALDMICWLAEKGAIFVEQPLPKNMLDETAWITEQSPIPVIADEAVQTLDDIEKINGAYSGINIKLMKCGGLLEAKKMIERARELQMKILIGCMSESSCAVTAAAHLSPFCDWADLDGPYLIKNDTFEGMKIVEGKIFIPDEVGTGAWKK